MAGILKNYQIFDVDGIEISSTAIKLAKEFNTKSNFIHSSIFV